MFRYIIRRLAMTVPTLLGGFIVIFLITRMVPGDPVMLIMEEYYTQESYDAIEERLGLHRPIWQQFIYSLTDALRGDFGTSFQNNRPVTVNIGGQLVDTLLLTGAALLLAGLIGIPAGVVAAVRRNTWVDYLAMVGALLALCAPVFWLGILLILAFSLQLGWFPTYGVGAAGDPISKAHHLVLPALALGATGAGLVARITRSAMLDTLAQDYVRTARAKGLAERNVVYRHGLRNALLPVSTVFGLEIVTLLTGTVIVETVFARRGIGKLLVDAIIMRDYPQIQAILLLFIVVAVVVSLLVDIAYSFIDPRVRYE
jgi:ABC-type dipeptide/oligopeptide/nickel transport system permease component